MYNCRKRIYIAHIFHQLSATISTDGKKKVWRFLANQILPLFPILMRLFLCLLSIHLLMDFSCMENTVGINQVLIIVFYTFASLLAIKINKGPFIEKTVQDPFGCANNTVYYLHYISSFLSGIHSFKSRYFVHVRKYKMLIFMTKRNTHLVLIRNM